MDGADVTGQGNRPGWHLLRATPRTPNGQTVSARKLFAIFVGLAVMFAPSVAYAGMPVAAVPHHGMQMMAMGHCQMPSSKSSDHNMADGKSCCMSMCMAVAMAPSAPLEPVVEISVPTYFAEARFWHGYLGEIATPPPKRS